MSSVKKSLLQEISDRIKRKKALQKEMSERNTNIDAFVLKMIGEIDDMMKSTVNSSLGPMLANYYEKAIYQRMRVLDNHISVEISWCAVENGDKPPQINGILIRWSPEYQVKNNCEPELFVDIVGLLFN